MRAHTTDSGGATTTTSSTSYADGDGGSDASAAFTDATGSGSNSCSADADSPAPPADCAANPRCAAQYAQDYLLGAHGVGCIITGPGPDATYVGDLKWDSASGSYWFVGSKTTSSLGQTSSYSIPLAKPTLMFKQTMPQSQTPPNTLLSLGLTMSGDFSHVVNTVKCVAGLEVTARLI